MGYIICKFQNTSPYTNDIPTISITEKDPQWDQAKTNWLNGNNPTNSNKWTEIFAITKEI